MGSQATATATARATPEPLELTIDELARRADLPARTIREYQTIGLLPPPRRSGRVGVYSESHLHRLDLIGRLQQRGYSLAAIRDLLLAWRDGDDLGEVLGLRPDQLVHVEEPGTPATIEQLEQLLPLLVPQRLSELLATGVVELCGDETYCVPSPSLLHLAADALRVGYTPDTILELLDALGRAAESIADAAVAAIAQRPAEATPEDLVAFATRARGLLAHGTGRLAIHALGRHLGITDEADVADGMRRMMDVDNR